MAAFIWPLDLPQKVNRDFTETGNTNIVRSPMDAGPAKMRRRSEGVKTLNVSFDMTTANCATFETFVYSTLNSTARFDFVHPRTGTTVEVRIVPGTDGQLFTSSYIIEGRWRISFKLEVLP
jgi:hypothetical protein